ncbi:hypothetical protein OIDMADRAFT_184873 [Oidiodendron maius Zn]|uniref:Uncharacterized protein n=1 Tax=Oidiodendron maius (strain Zn) TaxID=913774 RepID=A0A0C3C2H0_OIDMZ|nr:hypothetical protein OIDMADRAFT_184873 [Oidiodendron maius Zn]
MAQSRTDTTFGNLGRGIQIGINNGPILSAERPETPPVPLSTVRFPRDADYVDRQVLLERVCTKCSISGSWTALVGLGRVRKSQLAIEYSYQVRDQLPDIWVFWVYMSNAACLE